MQIRAQTSWFIGSILPSLQNRPDTVKGLAASVREGDDAWRPVSTAGGRLG